MVSYLLVSAQAASCPTISRVDENSARVHPSASGWDSHRNEEPIRLVAEAHRHGEKGEAPMTALGFRKIRTSSGQA
jgi:hypothetical protein